MNLAELLAAIGKIEGEGAEMKTFLKKFIADKDATIAVAESLANTAESRLETLAKTLDCTPDTIGEKIKTLQGLGKEVETLKQTEQSLKTKIVEVETAKKTSDRLYELREFCGVVGADFKAVSKLLPPDVVFKVITTKGEDDKEITSGVVVKDNKDVDFADYVDADDQLKTFRASIFNQQNNPPAPTNGKLPSGKSPDKSSTPAATVASSMLAQQKARAAKLLERAN